MWTWVSRRLSSPTHRSTDLSGIVGELAPAPPPGELDLTCVEMDLDLFFS